MAAISNPARFIQAMGRIPSFVVLFCATKFIPDETGHNGKYVQVDTDAWLTNNTLSSHVVAPTMQHGVYSRLLPDDRPYHNATNRHSTNNAVRGNTIPA